MGVVQWEKVSCFVSGKLSSWRWGMGRGRDACPRRRPATLRPPPPEPSRLRQAAAECVVSACTLCLCCPLMLAWCCVCAPLALAWRTARCASRRLCCCCRGGRRPLIESSSFSDVELDVRWGSVASAVGRRRTD